MINTTILNYSLQPFQFLSVCHYISSIGLLFSKNGLILPKEQYESIPVLNAFFDYLNNSTNETEAKGYLLQKVLNRTDLYGGGENETLDIEYIDDTFHYIISETLFSNYGGISGYVAGIINRSKIVTLSILKKTVFHDFSHNYIMKDPCSLKGNWSNCNNCNNCNETIYCKKTTKLTSHTIAKVFENYIWVIFPKAEADTNITDINYLYAMAGLKIAKNLPGGLSNLTFDDYVLLAHTTESMVLRNETSKSVLVSFSDPALFLFAYQSKNHIRERKLTSEFWNKAYENLFSYFRETTQTILKTVFENSLYQKLENELSKLISRTKLASEILYLFCAKNISVSNSETMIALYKTSQWFVEHEKFGCNPNIPNLSEMFEKQFSDVRHTYKEIEKKSIQSVLAKSDLLSKINSPNTTVLRAEIPPSSMASMSCLLFLVCLFSQPQKPQDNIYFLFAIKQNGKTEFFALKQEENSLIIIPKDGNEENFDKEVGIDFLSNIAVARFTDSLKDENENSTDFIERVASIKTDDFVRGLYNYYYEETLGETVINGLLTLVPFYSCVQNGKDGNIRGAVLSCSLDVLSLLPLVGVATKYTTVLSRSLIVEVQKGLTVVNAGASFRAVGFSELIKTAMRTAAANVLPKVVFTDISIATIRTLDPGFEAFYRIGMFGVDYYVKLYRYFLSNAKRLIISSKLLGIVKSAGKKNQITDLISVVGQYSGHDLVRYTYPTGSHFFGPSFLKLFGMLAEMRTASRTLEKIPIIPFKVEGNEILYKRVNPKNGRLSEFEMKFDKRDLLLRVDNFVKLLEVGNQFHSFDVYYNEMEWMPDKTGNLVENADHAFGSGPPLSTNSDISGVSTDLENPEVSASFPSSSNSAVSASSASSANLAASQTFKDYPLSDNSPVADGSKDLKVGTSVEIPKEEEPSSSPKTVNTLKQKETSNFDLVKAVKENKLTVLKDDKSAMKQLRILFYRSSLKQSNKPWSGEPIDLWYTEVRSQRNIIEHLSKLKGKRFFFGEMVRLTKHHPEDLPEKLSLSWDTKIIYNLKFPSQYGVLDLERINSDLKDLFLISKDIPFSVKEVYFSNEKTILNLELEAFRIRKGNWETYAVRKLNWFAKQIIKTPRMTSIERAAEFITSNLPGGRMEMFRKKLREFYLKLEPSQSSVPTYDKLAEDFCNYLRIPDSYKRWKIKKSIYLDDVLFKKQLDRMTELAEAERKIGIIYKKLDLMSVQVVFDGYVNSPSLRENLRFEDYYAIRAHLAYSIVRDLDSRRRRAVAFYRLALRQADQEWAKEPIRLYFGEWVELEVFRKHESFKVKQIIEIQHLQQGYRKRELVEHFLEKRKLSPMRALFFEMSFDNQYGLADLERVSETEKGEHLISSEMKFVVDDIVYETIGGQNVLVVKVHNLNVPKEEKMLKIVNKLEELWDTETQYYVD